MFNPNIDHSNNNKRFLIGYYVYILDNLVVPSSILADDPIEEAVGLDADDIIDHAEAL